MLAFLIFLTDFKRLLTCLDDFALSLALFTFVITVWLSLFIRMAGNGFSTTGKSIKSSRGYSASTVAVSKVASSSSMVDLVNMVYLQDLHDTAPPPRRNAYPLVAYSSSTSDIQFESLYPSSTAGCPE